MRVKLSFRTARRIVAVTAIVTLLAGIAPGIASGAVTGILGTALTNDAFDQGLPDVWRGIVVWRDDRVFRSDIYGYDWNTGTPLTICTAAETQTYPAVGDEYVVWQDFRSGNYDIWAYSLVTHTEELICGAAGAQTVPDIYQRYIVWQDFRSSTSWDIYAYDLVEGVEIPICTDAGAQVYPAIWGDTIVWQDHRSGTANIWMHNISSGKTSPVSPSANAQTQPDVCQEWVVWEELSPSGYGIRGYNLSSGEALTIYDAPGDQIAPKLDGDWLFFHDQAGGGGDIGFVDLLNREIYDVFPTAGTSRQPAAHMGTVVYTFDNGADTEIMLAEPVWTHDVQPLSGINRYDTAGLTARASRFSGSTDVVIATGENFPDALGAAALAGKMNAALLLTPGGHLSDETASALTDLGVSGRVIVVGGPTAISNAVIDEIDALLPVHDPIRRVAGTDRYQTALAIAEEIAGGTGLDKPYAFVCTGRNFPDALAASSMAYALDIPVYLVPGDAIPAATIDAMADHGVTIPIIVGGESVVGPNVEDALVAEFGEYNVWRVWGSDRYETAYELANLAQGQFDFGASGVCVATGETFPDALAGSQLAGNRYAPLLLSRAGSLPEISGTWLSENSEEIRYVTFLGGTAALSSVVRTAVSSHLK